jgi:hypothetical protein
MHRLKYDIVGPTLSNFTTAALTTRRDIQTPDISMACSTVFGVLLKMPYSTQIVMNDVHEMTASYMWYR